MSYFKTRIIQPVAKFLKQGISPHQLALSLSLGIVIGLFPMIGCTTIICTVVALVLGLNMPLIQLVNQLVYPLQLLLYIPFMNIGITMFSTGATLSIATTLHLFQNGFWKAIVVLGWSNALGVAVWGLISIPLFALCYYTSLMIFKRTIKNSEVNAPTSN